MRQVIELSIWTTFPNTHLKIVGVYKKNNTLSVISSLMKCPLGESLNEGATHERNDKVMILEKNLPVTHYVLSNNIAIEKANVPYIAIMDKEVLLLEQNAYILYKNKAYKNQPESIKIYQDGDLSKHIIDNYLDNYYPVMKTSLTTKKPAISTPSQSKNINNYMVIGGLGLFAAAVTILGTGVINNTTDTAQTWSPK